MSFQSLKRHNLSFATFLFSLIIILILFKPVYAQLPQFEWAKKAGGSGADYGYAIAADRASNVFVTGFFHSVAMFVPFELVSYGGSEIFIVKYDAAGNALWAKQADGTGDEDSGYGVATDQFDNCIVTGIFRETAIFENTTLTSIGNRDIFIAKYNPSGKLQWAKRAGGTSYDYAFALATDPAGNSFITGYFSTAITFDTITVNGIKYADSYLAKYDPAGNAVWAKPIAGPDWVEGRSVAADNEGNCFITGHFTDKIVIESIELNSAGEEDIFIAKFDRSGNLQWAKRAGGNSFDRGFGVATDSEGNCYITGYFSDTAIFDSTPVNSYGKFDIFIAKYDKSGNLSWVRHGGGTEWDEGHGIATDNMNFCFVTGNFRYQAEFDGATITGDSHDPFVAKYDPAGNIIWAKHIQGSDGRGIAADFSGNSYVTGFFRNTALFDSIAITSDGVDDIFVAKIQEAPTSITVIYPDGGEIWSIGQRYKIRWTSDAPSGSVIIALSIDGGMTWYELPDGSGKPTPNDGEYYFTPAIEQISDQCLVEITSVENPAIKDQSDAVFSITSELPDRAYLAVQIPESYSVPTLDGNFDEPIWELASQDSLLYGGPAEAWNTPWLGWENHLVTWKAIWSASTNRLYVALDITDNVRGIFDNNDENAPPYLPWEDESIEFYIDGDHRGGNYEGRFDIAQQWRVSGEGIRNLANYPSSQAVNIYHGDDFKTSVKYFNDTGNWRCEAEFAIYDSLPDFLRTLTTGDTLGWEIWYNDSDNENNAGGYFHRDYQTGWKYSGQAYKNADYFGQLVLASETYSISGKLGYYSSPVTAVPDAIVNLTGETALVDSSDVNGNYGFQNLAPDSITITPQKTAETKDAISAYDASFILRYAVGLLGLSPYQKIAADVTGNGEITSYDASFILRYYVGIIDTFPVAADWMFVPDDFAIDDTSWATSPRSRHYSPLDSNQTDQDFLGILYGDVSGNWATGQANGSNSVVELNVENLQKTANGRWMIPIDMKFSGMAYSGSFALIANNPALKFISGSIENASSKDLVFAANECSGVVNVAFAAAHSLDGNNVNIALLFEGSGASASSPSQFEFTEIKVDDKIIATTIVSHRASSDIPKKWNLSQNQPNPFNPVTTIRFDLTETADITIVIYNINGQEVKTLVRAKKNAGSYVVSWNALDDYGKPVATGIYIYQMKAEYQGRIFSAAKRMVLLR